MLENQERERSESKLISMSNNLLPPQSHTDHLFEFLDDNLKKKDYK